MFRPNFLLLINDFIYMAVTTVTVKYLVCRHILLCPSFFQVNNSSQGTDKDMKEDMFSYRHKIMKSVTYLETK